MLELQAKFVLGGGGGSGVPGPIFPAMCPMVNRMMEDKNGPNMACGEGHILELWAVNGTLGSESEAIINGLTDEVRYEVNSQYQLQRFKSF